MKDTVKQHLQDLLTKLTVSVDAVEYESDTVAPLYKIVTKDAGVLIGNNGEHLRALNYVARKIIETKVGVEASQFLLDVNGYQRKKLDTIRQQARLLAERARTFKASVEMDPLNAYERMIVHNMFSEDPDIQTESVGEGKGRHVVFRYTSQHTFRSADEF